MERRFWGHHNNSNNHNNNNSGPHQHRRGRSETSPSFSSSLLDAILHSLDAEAGAAPKPHPINTGRRRTSLDDPHNYQLSTILQHKKGGGDCETTASAYSSSVSSLSSSASTASTAASLTTTTSDDSISNAPKKKKKKPSCGAIRSRFRRAPPEAAADSPPAKSPTSPAARLAGFLNSIFMYASIRRKAKISGELSGTGAGELSGEGRRGEGESARSSTSSSACRRSCLSKGAAGGRRRERSVRFCVAGEEASGPAGERGDRRPVPARVEEVLRRVAPEMEEEEVVSESSSELFELEDLGVGIGGDELPVYGTTSVSTNIAIARGLI